MRLFGRRRGRRSKSGPKRRLARRLIRSAAGLLIAFYVFCTLSLWILRSMNPLWTSVQLQRRIEAFFAGEDYAKRQTFVLLDRIPLVLQHAVIAAEDGAFYRHQGIDWAEIKLLADEIRGGGRVRGASTISQQLVKNLFLTTHRSIVRKAFEFTLVPIAELILGKPRILELYLNVIEWGPGIYGVQEASDYHYGVPVAQLGRDQAARLAACIPSPRIWKPARQDRYSREILKRMENRGW